MPLAATCPRPSIETSVALDVCQLRVVEPPGLIVSGLAVMEAVGAGAVAGGAGGGGGAGFFLWQPATVSTAAKLAASARDFLIVCCTFSPPWERGGRLYQSKTGRNCPPANVYFPTP